MPRTAVDGGTWLLEWLNEHYFVQLRMRLVYEDLTVRDAPPATKLYNLYVSPKSPPDRFSRCDRNGTWWTWRGENRDCGKLVLSACEALA